MYAHTFLAFWLVDWVSVMSHYS